MVAWRMIDQPLAEMYHYANWYLWGVYIVARTIGCTGSVITCIINTSTETLRPWRFRTVVWIHRIAIVKLKSLNSTSTRILYAQQVEWLLLGPGWVPLITVGTLHSLIKNSQKDLREIFETDLARSTVTIWAIISNLPSRDICYKCFRTKLGFTHFQLSSKNLREGNLNSH